MLSKTELRNQARANRIALASAMPDFASTIAGFADDLVLPSGVVVAGYWPVRGEADPRALMMALRRKGHSLALPCIAGKKVPLIFRSWYEDDVLAANDFGIGEPEAHREIRVPSVMLVPLLAFDASGHRLGYGGGHYDRTLAAYREKGEIIAIGIAYAGQKADRIPHDANDQRLDMVLTETGIEHFG